MINCNIKNISYIYYMNKIIQYLPIILIITLFVAVYLGYNNVIANQAEQRAIHEITAKQMEEMNNRLDKEDKVVEAFKMVIKEKDSLLILERQKRETLQKEVNRNRDNYNSIAVPLPDL